MSSTPLITADFAIVVCSYNPDDRVFSRTLDAIAQLEIPATMNIECVIVDNNSATVIAQMPYVQSFLARCPWAKVILELEQGLTFARIAGVRSTNAPILVFIDDDNEPDSTYLTALDHCFKTYPMVAAWGPGKVKVDFIEPVSSKFEGLFRGKFQERDWKYTEYGCVQGRWIDFYPFGTGLAVKRDIIDRYCKAVESGTLAAVDRQGKSLSSAGDIQIVWEAAKLGLAAGISPDLRLNHVIPPKRTTIEYIKRLTYGTASSYAPALIRSFTAEKDKAPLGVPSDRLILTSMLSLIVRRMLRFNYKLLVLDLAKYLGKVVGAIRAVNPDDQHWVFRLVKILRLE